MSDRDESNTGYCHLHKRHLTAYPGEPLECRECVHEEESETADGKDEDESTL